MICLALAWAGPAAGLDGLQIIEITGHFLDAAGQELAEFDYLEPGQKYRLMPGASTELASLDGLKTWRAQGPGVVSFDKSGRVTLNGKSLATASTQAAVTGTATGAGTTLAAVTMRGNDGVKVLAKEPSGRARAIRLYSGYHALVIGCSDYRSGWPPLPNPVNDAKEVAGLLRSLNWTVEVVANPDGRTLRQALNVLITGPGRKEDMAILVWYSGHGYTLKQADGSKLGYIVPVDAPDPRTDEIGFMDKAVSMRQMETVAFSIMSKHVLMMFDSCFSGSLFQITRAIPSAFIEEKVSKPVRQFVTAGTEDEQVPDKSYFKTVFIQGLDEGYADLNRDGYVTGQEIGAYLQEQVVNYSKKAQHPQYGKINNPKLDKGDFVFVLEKLPPAAGSAKPADPARMAAAAQPASTGAGRSIQTPPAQAAPAEREAVLNMINRWNQDWNRLDQEAILAHYAPGATIAFRDRMMKMIVVDRDKYSMVLQNMARRVRGRRTREILEVLSLDAAAGRAVVNLRTKVVGPASGAIIVERLNLVEQDGRWLISKYRFSKLDDLDQAVTSGQADSDRTGRHDLENR